MTEFRYDTQLLIEGQDLDEDVISEYFTEHFKGDCLLAVGDDELMSPGRCWNTAPPWGKSMTLWWKTWTDSPEDCRDRHQNPSFRVV